MAVALLRGENFRLYASFGIEPHPELNLVVGDNAAGKTTLLEALYVTGRGRSFRGAGLSEIAGPAGAAWNAFFQTRNGPDRAGRRFGIGWSREGTNLRIDQERAAKLSDVVRAVPMQIIDPAAYRLLDDGPAYRRSYIDWGVFHVEHRFHDIWRRFQRALQQRNRALREQLDDRSVEAWNEDLAQTAEELTRMREAHVQAAAGEVGSCCGRLIGEPEVRLDFVQGWTAGERYRDVLSRHLDQHRRQATTVQGPHRAELRIELPQGRARGRVSRGQQKLIVTAMVLAQCRVLMEAGHDAPILLLDDFAAELSPESQDRLAAELLRYPGQKFVTSFETPPAFSSEKSRLFHVEQGTIRAVDGPT